MNPEFQAQKESPVNAHEYQHPRKSDMQILWAHQCHMRRYPRSALRSHDATCSAFILFTGVHIQPERSIDRRHAANALAGTRVSVDSQVSRRQAGE
jgi:hypothetical protein